MTLIQSSGSLWLLAGIVAWYAVSTASSILLNSALQLHRPATSDSSVELPGNDPSWLLPLADSLLFTCLSSLTSLVLIYMIQYITKQNKLSSSSSGIVSVGSSPCSEYRAFASADDSSDVESAPMVKVAQIQVQQQRHTELSAGDAGRVALLAVSHMMSSCLTAYALTLSSIICVHTWRALEPALAGLFTYCAYVAQQRQLVGSQQGITRSFGLMFVVAGVWLATSSEANCAGWQSMAVAGTINLTMILRNSTIKRYAADQLEQAYKQMYTGSTVVSMLGLLALLYQQPTLLLRLSEQRDFAVLMLAAALTQSIYTQLSLTICTRVALLSHSLLTLLKRPLLLIAASIWYATMPTTVTILGNIVSLCGLTMYITSNLQPNTSPTKASADLTLHAVQRPRAPWLSGAVATVVLLVTLEQRYLQQSDRLMYNTLLDLGGYTTPGSTPFMRLWHSDAVSQRRQEMQMLPLYTGGRCDYSRAQNASLYYWRRPWLGHNFGDRLSWILFQEMLATYDDVISLQTAGSDSTTRPSAAVRGSLYMREDEPTDLPFNMSDPTQLRPPPRLLAVGSIMQFTITCDVVWGSGARSLYMEGRRTTDIDIRAVRGPLTRQYLLAQDPTLHVPEIYGDPALLTPLFFPEYITTPAQRSGILVIAHFADIALVPNQTICNTGDNTLLDTTRGLSGLPGCYVTSQYDGRNIRFMNALNAWDEVVGNITASELVISTSLHGIILADAYGIPARLLRLSEAEPLFKYADYYAGTGRTFQPVGSIQEALWLGGEPPAHYDPMPLLQAFPIDLYTS